MKNRTILAEGARVDNCATVSLLTPPNGRWILRDSNGRNPRTVVTWTKPRIASNSYERYHSFQVYKCVKVRNMLATMTSKGQITIPKQARDALQLHPGDRVEFVFGDDGRLFLLSATRPIGSLKGMLPKPARPVSLEEMDAAIAASARP